MALGDPYATATELKARLEITVTTYNNEIDDALAAASRDVEKYCRRQFNKTTTATARVFHPTSCVRADVDDFHTTTDLAIATDSGDDGTYETTWVAADYQLEPLNGIVDGESGWPYRGIVAAGSRTFTAAGRRPPLQVTAQWGWTAVPAPVKAATLILAGELFKLREAPFGVVGNGDFGVVRVQNNRKVSELLMKYRHQPILVG
jgi:hypothetical protein